MKIIDGIVPVGTSAEFLAYWDGDLLGLLGEENLSEFELEIEYEWELLIDPIGYTKRIVWKEMSYNKLKEYSLTR
jgi:hypothetical protein